MLPTALQNNWIRIFKVNEEAKRYFTYSDQTNEDVKNFYNTVDQFTGVNQNDVKVWHSSERFCQNFLSGTQDVSQTARQLISEDKDELLAAVPLLICVTPNQGWSFLLHTWENELAILEFIHLLVETMDRHFGNVCELDIMFHLEKAHFMLEEMVMNGCIVETSKANILTPIQLMDKAS
ncbi:AP-4 complex subunit sigma-1 [Capsicum annuum]|nr:AP-4 complex subunit sigma-1 [Capsicum annuum]